MSEQLKTRQEVETQINKINAEIGGLLTEKDDKSRRANKLRLELEQLEGQLSEKTNGATAKDSKAATSLDPPVNEMNLSAKEAEALKTARWNLAAATDSCSKITELINSKEQQLSALLQEKSRLINAASTGAIISYQNQLEQAKQTVVMLRGAIAGQQDIITTANESLSRNHDLKDKRAEILAEIAINGSKYTAKDLENIDKQIQAEFSKTEANRKKVDTAIVDAKQTIAGLEAKLNVAREELADLEAKGDQVLQEFLTAEAERAGETYFQAVNSLEAAFRQLVAINKIRLRKGFSAIASGSAEALFIPAFKLNALSGKQHNVNNNSLRMINTAANYREALQQDIADIISRWEENGITVI